MELAPCRAQQGLPRLYRLGWAVFLPGSGVCCWNTVQSWEHSVLTVTCHYRKTEGKAATTSELPPEYLTSPLSQQSQVSGCPIGDLVILTSLWIPLLTTSSFFHCSCLQSVMRQLCKRKRSSSWLLPCLSQRLRRRREWFVCCGNLGGVVALQPSCAGP